MEEELQKRNTDCVYFLASPLTCKKGAECEYRHSETARLNPRDCWYWMSGSCLNPSCAFRHPPLEARTETSSESTPNQSSVPPNKTNVPCYYYYNMFCNKGEKCSFLHGPVNSMSTWKSSNTFSVNPNGPSLEKKASSGSDTGSAPAVAKTTNSYATGHQQTAASRKELDIEIHQSAPLNEKRNASPLTPESPIEDAAEGRSNAMLLASGSFHRRSHTSSPGFDVLVDDGSEELGNEEESEYVLDHDLEGGEFNGHTYGYEENGEETDPAYAGLSTLNEKRHDFDDHLVNELNVDFVRKGAAPSRGSVLDCIERGKRRFLGRANYGQDGVDLRDLLKRRKMDDDDYRKLGSSRLISGNRERSRSQGEHHLHGRWSSEYDNGGRSRVLDEGRQRRSHFDRSRLQERPHHISSEVTRKVSSTHRSYSDDPTTFSGPKTLAQIKEEKKRARGNGEPSSGSSTFAEGILQDDFQAPKSLDKILEEKRRLRSQVDGNNEIK